MDFTGGSSAGVDGRSSSGDVDRRSQAHRWLQIADRLLSARDLVGCKRFAERALELDPFSSDSTADSILAAAEVLLAYQSRPLNYYSILGLKPLASSPADIARSFRHLSLLLNNLSSSPAGAAAFDLVSQAYSVLSDNHQKSLFDANLRRTTSNANNEDGRQDADLFWSACSTCCHVHQYSSRLYINRTLKCPSCRAAFCATELPSSPQIVPGTDMYFCSWGFFPLGFPGAEFPQPIQTVPKNVVASGPLLAQPKTGRNAKVVAVKKVGNSAAKKKFSDTNENAAGAGRIGEVNRVKPVVIDINEEWDVNQEAMGGMQGEDVDISSFDIEIDVDNMQSFSFL